MFNKTKLQPKKRATKSLSINSIIGVADAWERLKKPVYMACLAVWKTCRLKNFPDWHAMASPSLVFKDSITIWLVKGKVQLHHWRLKTAENNRGALLMRRKTQYTMLIVKDVKLIKCLVVSSYIPTLKHKVKQRHLTRNSCLFIF